MHRILLESQLKEKPIAYTKCGKCLKKDEGQNAYQFIFPYQDLVEIYSVSAEQIINDGFSYSENV